MVNSQWSIVNGQWSIVNDLVSQLLFMVGGSMLNTLLPLPS